jgi:hypothetical protein
MRFLCVLKSGGLYDKEWVRKLRDAVKRNCTKDHRFACLSDVEVPCERINLIHDWPGWWSKIELYRPGVIEEPTLYLDLDTVITGNIDHLTDLQYDFAMLQNFHQRGFVNSSLVWFRNKDLVPHKVYEKFLKMPEAYMAHHKRTQHDSYIGDQAFVWDALGGRIPLLSLPTLKSYKYHCRNALPKDASIVVFHGPPRPSEIKTDWMTQHWV